MIPLYIQQTWLKPLESIQLYWFFFKPGGSITIFVSSACKWNRTWFTLLKCPQGCGDLDLQIIKLQDAVKLFFLFCIHKGGRPTSERTFARWIRACIAEEYTKKKRELLACSSDHISQGQYLLPTMKEQKLHLWNCAGPQTRSSYSVSSNFGSWDLGAESYTAFKRRTVQSMASLITLSSFIF